MPRPVLDSELVESSLVIKVRSFPFLFVMEWLPEFLNYISAFSGFLVLQAARDRKLIQDSGFWEFINQGSIYNGLLIKDQYFLCPKVSERFV